MRGGGGGGGAYYASLEQMNTNTYFVTWGSGSTVNPFYNPDDPMSPLFTNTSSGTWITDPYITSTSTYSFFDAGATGGSGTSGSGAPNNYSYFNQYLKDLKSCFVDTGLGTIAKDMDPFSPSALNAIQGAIDAQAQSSVLAAGAYSVGRGLIKPLSSSAVRSAFTGPKLVGGWIAGAEVLGRISGWITIANLYYAIGDAYKNEWKKCGW